MNVRHLMVAAYRRVARWAEVMLGGQLNILSASLDGSGPVAVDQNETKTWFETLIGGRLTARGTRC